MSRESPGSLLESLENAIGALQSRDEPRMRGVITRLERRQAEIVAALASKERHGAGAPTRGRALVVAST